MAKYYYINNCKNQDSIEQQSLNEIEEEKTSLKNNLESQTSPKPPQEEGASS